LRKSFKIFINRETYEIKSIIDPNEIYSDLEIWEEELDKLERFTTTWPTALEKDEYLFTMNNVSKEELENERIKNKG
jgi:hypothetical protein